MMGDFHTLLSSPDRSFKPNTNKENIEMNRVCTRHRIHLLINPKSLLKIDYTIGHK